MAEWLTGRVTRVPGFSLLADLFLGLFGSLIGGWIFGGLGISFFGFVRSVAAVTLGAVVLVSIARLFQP